MGRTARSSLLQMKSCQRKQRHSELISQRSSARGGSRPSRDDPRTRAPGGGGSLDNSRISCQKTSCEPSRGGKGCGTGQPGQKDSRRLPSPSLGSKQFRSALEKKYPGLKISCKKLFSNRCQTHSIQICHVPGSSPYLGDPINSTQCQ